MPPQGPAALPADGTLQRRRGRTAYTFRMLRRLLLALVTLLVLQWTGAAVAALCLHEAGGAQAQHLGHHAHQHLQPADHADEAAPDAGLAHADCAGCHLAHGAVLPQTAPVALPVLPRDAPALAAAHVLPPSPPDSLFRPLRA